MIMDSYLIKGGKKLSGEVTVSGAKNMALKALVASCLTSEQIVIENIPLISDLYVIADIIKKLGGEIAINDHKAIVKMKKFVSDTISLDDASHTRTSSMFLAPLLLRTGKAMIPNPGGCRLGARPIDRTIQGLVKMGAQIRYDSDDGYFHANVKNKLKGINYRFEKNTHTGTETLIIAAVLAKGKTVLENAAEEPEVDDLVSLLNGMGAKIKRIQPRVIEVDGVERLHSTTFRIPPDRNEIVTFAVAAIITRGDILIKGARNGDIKEFLDKLEEAGGGFENKKDGLRFFYRSQLKATSITTKPYPGFMTDWQAPWTVLMTSTKGESIIHETVFENRFSYVNELKKMGANITLFNLPVDNTKTFYNFNPSDDAPEYFHAAKVIGPTSLHNAIVDIADLRAGATLVIAALAAKGDTFIHGIDIIERGYEQFDERIRKLGGDIKVIKE